MISRLLVGLWHLAAVAGLATFWIYAAQPAASSAVRWPASSAIHRTEGRPTLVMFAHPMSARTRTGLDELSRLLERTSIDTVVVFYRPRGDNSWVRSDAARAAASIPGVRIAWDDDGVEANRFGCTSGQALLYDAGGALRFNGGVARAASFARGD